MIGALQRASRRLLGRTDRQFMANLMVEIGVTLASVAERMRLRIGADEIGYMQAVEALKVAYGVSETDARKALDITDWTSQAGLALLRKIATNDVAREELL